MTAAEHQVDRLARAARWGKAVIVVMVIALLGLGFLYWQQHDTLNKLNQQAVVNCQAGNAFKAGDLKNWQLFIQVALGPHPSKDAVGKAQEIIAGVAGRDVPRDCDNLPG